MIFSFYSTSLEYTKLHGASSLESISYSANKKNSLPLMECGHSLPCS